METTTIARLIQRRQAVMKSISQKQRRSATSEQLEMFAGLEKLTPSVSDFLAKICQRLESAEKNTQLQRQKALCINSGYGRAKSRGTFIAENKLYEKTKRNPRYYRINGTDKPAVTFSSLDGAAGAKNGLYKVTNYKVRMLTPMECERLQGFPEGWTAGYSDGQRYKMLGNAVSVPVVEATRRKILRFLGKERGQ